MTVGKFSPYGPGVAIGQIVLLSYDGEGKLLIHP